MGDSAMFMDRDFLLSTEVAKRLYHGVAEGCPIVDYHCHIDPREIWEDRRFDNITQVWLGGDHYKWRLMRSAGVPEKYITGDADDHDKFIKWAGVLGRAIGNPLYQWSHLELRRYFGYEGLLNAGTAETVWDLTNERLRGKDYSARGLIGMSNVEVICTTDDPADSLGWHEKLAADPGFGTAVLPAWRPDRAMNPENPDYPDYLIKLEKASSVSINSFAALKEALTRRMAFFRDHGCRVSDHGLNRVMAMPASEGEAEALFRARLEGATPDAEGADRFRFALLSFLAGEYRRLGWVMQMHYGCRRNNNGPMARQIGPDTGFDCVDDSAASVMAAAFLGHLEDRGALPKTILYSLNATANAAIDSIIGCFQNDEAVSRVQHGAAWWFDDHFDGIVNHLKSLAARGYLAGFVGMLTDSRSFLSYPRHEYFRRILCRVIGEWVADGQFPEDMEALEDIVRAICCENARAYFGFAGERR